LAAARERLEELPGARLVKASKVYETEPWGLKDQPWFHNQVLLLRLDPDWTPQAFLEALLGIEKDMGRKREGERFGPRIIDLDVLLFGDVVLESDALILPHPRMRLRAFILVPLAEIAPDLVFPDGEGVGLALSKRAFKISGNVIFEADA
jgi:2-amino-4-hydroxy-6-hydroxymethyldihydropteridine diphosphokinase